MNKIVLLATSLFLAAGVMAQEKTSPAEATGINFFHGTWAELLAESQKTGKPVFIDAYASWCGPCRMMAANTFTNEEVGKFFNEHFVNYKIDMEKGEGPVLRTKYNVTLYPTYLFIDSKGTQKYRTMGYLVPDTFIGEGKKAVEKFKVAD